MKFLVKINEVTVTDELENAWKNADFKELLKRFDYPDAESVADDEVQDFLFMAINDFEPEEAAAIVLEYKIGDALNEGQINNLANEMLREKMAEKYTDIDLHKPLFEVNQLLYKAYNGKFPHTQVNIIDFELEDQNDTPAEITKEIVLKALSHGLSENNLLNRLLGDQLEGKAPFPEAEGIVWELTETGAGTYRMITSEKWLTREDFVSFEFESVVKPYQEEGDAE